MTAVILFSPSLEEVITVAFNISITDDTAVESNEQFEVILSSSQEAVMIEREASSATVNIIDDDSKPCILEGIYYINQLLVHMNTLSLHL